MASSGYYRPPQRSEMAVFIRAKELSKKVFIVTQDAPKKFRFSLVSKLQDLSLAVVGHLYRANEIFIDTAVLNSKKSFRAYGISHFKRLGENTMYYSDEEKVKLVELISASRLPVKKAAKTQVINVTEYRVISCA